MLKTPSNINPKDFFMIEQIRKFKEYNPNIKLGFASITGSDSYGFRSPDSDYDIRGVFYYNTKDQLKLFNNKKSNFNYDEVNIKDIVNSKPVGNGPFMKTEYRKYDFVFTEVSNFLQHINRMNCTTLEQLFSPFPVYINKHFEKLKHIVSQNLASKGLYDSYYGMAMFNYKHYIESNRKATIKKWLYVIRAYLSGIYALENGKIEQNITTLIENVDQLPHHAKQILRILVRMKQNNEEDKIAEEVEGYDNLHNKLLELRDDLEGSIGVVYRHCKLPNQPTDILREYLDYWIVDLRES